MHCLTSHCLLTDPHAEDDLQPYVFSSLQAVDKSSPAQPGLTDGLQLLPDGHSSGLAESDPGPMGVPAPQRDPAEEVLPGGQRGVQLFTGGTERA